MHPGRVPDPDAIDAIPSGFLAPAPGCADGFATVVRRSSAAPLRFAAFELRLPSGNPAGCGQGVVLWLTEWGAGPADGTGLEPLQILRSLRLLLFPRE